MNDSRKGDSTVALRLLRDARPLADPESPEGMKWMLDVRALLAAPPAQQQDTAAVVLAEIMAKMREESGDDDPMAPFQFDYSWEVLARRADAVLAAPAIEGRIALSMS